MPLSAAQHGKRLQRAAGGLRAIQTAVSDTAQASEILFWARPRSTSESAEREQPAAGPGCIRVGILSV